MSDNQKKRQARDEFHSLLVRHTREDEWQRFFSLNPFVLSDSLPLRLETQDIVPLGRPGHTEPDFIFYPSSVGSIPYHGVIEIKRPDSTIINVTRKNVATLSRDAETAIQQGRAYLKDKAKYFPHRLDDSLLFLGNTEHIFVIMGRSTELVAKLGTELFRGMIQERLPGNLQILPYDQILRAFEPRIPQPIFFLRVFNAEVGDVDIITPGRCLRCDAPALIDSAQCIACETEQYPINGEAKHQTDDTFIIMVPHPRPMTKDDLGAIVEYECDECGAKQFSVSFNDFCDYCAYQWDKLSRE